MADGGDVIYTLRGDDSELEKDLSNAEKKIEQSFKLLAADYIGFRPYPVIIR